uniref:cytochrome c oxidase subunit III n=1 Tax=Tachaea chinensis TaxID=1862870 RepID=UPI000EF32629|nr:cytochrome c oxidase subunit III [Tachaea chinensis]ATO58511.1 cytochrome c oxidase subunit 3 [Tachaea chinensis]
MSNMKFTHPYHLVDMSPWPLTSSLSALILVTGLTKWFTLFNMDMLLMGLLAMLLSMIQWWRDVTRESTFQGLHGMKVKLNMQWGMILFIISEILFFFSFFWAFFHSSLSPSMEIGLLWPPNSITPFNPLNIPLLNTIILLSSGITVTWSHHSIISNQHYMAILSLMLTIILGIYFTILQSFEYFEAPFSISDSIYGSTFFVATGFHGLHVIIGTSFLLVNLVRMKSAHLSSYHHFGFEAASWYWHFVDVVWLFLYFSVYWWGS